MLIPFRRETHYLTLAQVEARVVMDHEWAELLYPCVGDLYEVQWETISSILLNISLGIFSAFEHPETGDWLLLDGWVRLRALQEFRHGGLEFHPTVPRPCSKRFNQEALRGRRFDDLPVRWQNHFDDYVLFWDLYRSRPLPGLPADETDRLDYRLLYEMINRDNVVTARLELSETMAASGFKNLEVADED